MKVKVALFGFALLLISIVMSIITNNDISTLVPVTLGLGCIASASI